MIEEGKRDEYDWRLSKDEEYLIYLIQEATKEGMKFSIYTDEEIICEIQARIKRRELKFYIFSLE